MNAYDSVASRDNYENLCDEKVVELAQNGDDRASEYLISKYKNFVRAKARSYFLVGGDRDDIVQEGMIGLFKAIRDFRCGREYTFINFAELCVTRQIITAIKTATRQKHMPLNSYVSLNKFAYDDADSVLLDSICGDKLLNPEVLFISHEQIDDIEFKIGKALSNLEKQVLTAYLEGKSYVEISESLNRTSKSVDNALQRVKKKLEKLIM